MKLYEVRKHGETITEHESDRQTDHFVFVNGTRYGWDTQYKIDCIKEYAQSVAKQALKYAAENAKVMVTNPDTNHSHSSSVYDDPDGDTIMVCKESILNTEIQTP